MPEFGSWVTQSPLTADPDMTVQDAAILMKNKHVGSILITENGKPGSRLLGIFTERDVLNKVVAADKPAKTTRLTEVMTHNPKAMTPEDDYREILQAMDEGGFRHVPIVDANGGAIGVVSIRNLMKLVEARSMAETALDLTW